MKLARFAIAFGACAFVLAPHDAHAGAREEAAAKSALARAHTQHASRHYNHAFQILSQAEKDCEPDRCSPSTIAMLFRDMGTMQLLNGDDDQARGNFTAALSFDASIDLDPAYASNDVRTAWAAIKSPHTEQPSGDFDHTPASAQKQGVPLPVYVEYHGSAHPTSVVVRYEQNGTYRRLALVHIGNGWGNVIPCGASKLGTIHYYFQGLDSEGLPILDGGDRRHPYGVPIKASIDGQAPHLPGHRAPTTCGEGLAEEEAEGPSQPPATPPETNSAPKRFARVWIGVSAAIDFTVLPAGSDVCARDASGNPTDSNWSCTSDTPEGKNFPASQTENATLVQGDSGKVESGVQTGNVRIKATFDYAVTGNLLLGAAFGFVAGAYGGSVSPKFPPLHIEARGTWVFGSEPLAQAGFAPYIQLAGGVAEYDANLTITVNQNTFVGSRPVQAWHVGGPGFLALEGGLRYAFSARAAFILGVRATAAFGASFFPAFGPDAALVFGF